MFCIYAAYAYAFLIGSVWVERSYWNHAVGRPYTAGDTIQVFFGILFGMFAFAGIAPNFKLVAEG